LKSIKLVNSGNQQVADVEDCLSTLLACCLLELIDLKMPINSVSSQSSAPTKNKKTTDFGTDDDENATDCDDDDEREQVPKKRRRIEPETPKIYSWDSILAKLEQQNHLNPKQQPTCLAWFRIVEKLFNNQQSNIEIARELVLKFFASFCSNILPKMDDPKSTSSSQQMTEAKFRLDIINRSILNIFTGLCDVNILTGDCERKLLNLSFGYNQLELALKLSTEPVNCDLIVKKFISLVNINEYLDRNYLDLLSKANLHSLPHDSKLKLIDHLLGIEYLIGYDKNYLDLITTILFKFVNLENSEKRCVI
jgi:hypothetical protein